MRTSLVAATLALTLAGCVKGVEDSAEYKAACDGPPLRTVEKRNKAMEDGRPINRRFDCIENKAVVAGRDAKHRQETETELRRQARVNRQRAEEGAKQEADRVAAAPPPLPTFVLRDVEINTASEADLLPIPGITRDTAADIVALRKKDGRYADWADVVRRVIGLSAARNALFASMCGLRVNGEPLDRMPFDSQTTQVTCEKARGDT